MIHTLEVVCRTRDRQTFDSFKYADGTERNTDTKKKGRKPKGGNKYSQNRHVNQKFKEQGITVTAQFKKVPWKKGKDGYYYQYTFKAVVNLSKLLKPKEEITLYNPHTDYYEVIRRFNQIMEQLYLPQIYNWSVRRIDYAVNVRTKNVARYITMLQQGNMPPKMRICYNKDTRHHTHRKGSLRLTSTANDGRKKRSEGALTLNFYDKLDRLEKQIAEGEDIDQKQLERAQDVLRLEVQCYPNKIKELRKQLPENSMVYFISPLYAPSMSKKVIRKELLDVAGKNDYMRKSVAVRKIESVEKINGKKVTRPKRKKMLLILDKVAGSSIHAVKDKLIADKEIKMTSVTWRDYVKAFDALQMNMVTVPDDPEEKLINDTGELLPKEEGLPNLLKLFDEAVLEYDAVLE